MKISIENEKASDNTVDFDTMCLSEGLYEIVKEDTYGTGIYSSCRMLVIKSLSGIHLSEAIYIDKVRGTFEIVSGSKHNWATGGSRFRKLREKLTITFSSGE